MKKLIIGMLIGAALMFSAQTFANEVSLIGKKITKEVKVTMFGNKLENKAILLEGVTYVPLRVITEKLGYKASYENGEVFVKSAPEDLWKLRNEASKKKEDVVDLEEKVALNGEMIKQLEQRKKDEAGKTDYLPGFSPDEQLKIREEIGTEISQQLNLAKTQLAELEAKLAELEGK